jgi:hypothetical protein
MDGSLCEEKHVETRPELRTHSALCVVYQRGIGRAGDLQSLDDWMYPIGQDHTLAYIGTVHNVMQALCSTINLLLAPATFSFLLDASRLVCGLQIAEHGMCPCVCVRAHAGWSEKHWLCCTTLPCALPPTRQSSGPPMLQLTGERHDGIA